MSLHQLTHPYHLLNRSELGLSAFIFKLLVWLHKYGKKMAAGSVAVVLLVVVCQLMYPRNRALPIMYLEGKQVGFQSQNQVANQVSGLADSKLPISIGGTTYEPRLEELGVSFKADETAIDYPISARLVPFSAVFYGQKRLGGHVKAQVDETKARKYFGGIVDKHTRSVVEGSITIKEQKVVVNYPETGLAYDIDQIMYELRSVPFLDADSFTVPAAEAVPSYSRGTFAKAGADAELYLQKTITVTSQGKTIQITPETIAKSLRFSADPATKTVVVGFDRMVLLKALEPLADKLYVAPRSTRINTLDGNETSRQGGANGQALVYETTINIVISTFGKPDSTAVADVQPLKPSAQTSRSYSNTSNGLQTLVNDWTSDYRGPKWSVAVKELSGQNRYGAYLPDKPYFTASVYKLFLAYPILSDVASGAINPAASTSTGKSVDICIEQMIVLSSNGCAYALGDMLGWNNANDRIHSKGFGQTSLSNGSGFTTTASDTTRILEQLYHGTLLPQTQNNRLIDMMKRQIWRTGIPAGSRGIAVADKPGYVPGYVHDVAIVYHPKGAYAVSVFSTGGSYYQIANLVTRLNNYFYQ